MTGERSASRHSLETPPAVTVLIPVHNGEAYVEAAVRSIMDQTLRDIEILIVDDASTDGTAAILNRLAAEDERIQIEHLPTNMRLVGALNRGLALARAPYVARMDADDLARPERLDIQKRYLDAHPNVIALGSGLTRIRADGTPFQTTIRPRDDFMCRWIMRFRLPIVHPTTMFRHPAPDGTAYAYDSDFVWCEDHDFFGRMMGKGDIVCLPDVLLEYRHHGGSVTYSKWIEQNRAAKIICHRIMQAELPAETLMALEPVLSAFFDFKPVPTRDIFEGLRRMLAFDVDRAPAYRTWLCRQTAQLAFDTLRRSRHSKAAILRAFLGPGRDMLPSLAFRFAEIMRRSSAKPI